MIDLPKTLLRTKADFFDKFLEDNISMFGDAFFIPLSTSFATLFTPIRKNVTIKNTTTSQANNK